MYLQQCGYCRIIITKWSTYHCSSPLSFFFLFFSFFFFFQFTINLVLEKQGKSILHQVCGSYSATLPVVKILVENGADVNEIYQVFFLI